MADDQSALKQPGQLEIAATADQGTGNHLSRGKKKADNRKTIEVDKRVHIEGAVYDRPIPSNAAKRTDLSALEK